MVKSLGEIAQAVGARVVGDASLEIEDAKITARATSQDITLAAADKHLAMFMESDCLAVVIPESLSQVADIATGKSFVVVSDFEKSFAAIVAFFRPPIQRSRIGISEAAHIAASAQIAEDVDVYPGVFIGENVKIGCGAVIHPNVTIMDNATIGAGTTLFPNTTLYENSVIGERCILHSGVRIGAYGFGYESSDKHVLSAQLGNVVVGNDVEIGSNTTIDRGTYDATTIGDGTKIDDQVMIGHNCQIGKHNLLCSQVGIAGSTSTGDYVVMAGQVGVGDHLNIADKTILAAKSGVMHNLAGEQTYMGIPAVPIRQQMQLHALTHKLPEMRKQIRALKKSVESIEASADVAQSVTEAA